MLKRYPIAPFLASGLALAAASLLSTCAHAQATPQRLFAKDVVLITMNDDGLSGVAKIVKFTPSINEAGAPPIVCFRRLAKTFCWFPAEGGVVARPTRLDEDAT